MSTAEPAGALAGVHVLVTRPAQQAHDLCAALRAEGAEVLHFPVVEILDPRDTAALLALIDRLEEFSLAIFISANAVNKAMNLIRTRREWPAQLAVACVGKGSAKELRHFGFDHIITPSGRFDSEALLALPSLNNVVGQKIVIFRGDGGRELLGNTLSERGASVEYGECYRRAKPNADVAPLLRAWARNSVDVVTLTSVEGLRNLYDLLGKLGQSWLIKTPVVVISERIAQACRELGFKHEPLIADEASDAAIVRTIRNWHARQKAL